MTITGAPERLIPRWARQSAAPAGTAELSYALPVRLAARIRLLGRRSAGGWEAALLSAHTVVLSALSGERALVTGYVPHPGSGAAPEAPRARSLEVDAESWRELLTASLRSAARPVDGAFETVLDLGDPDGAFPAPEHPAVVLTAALRYGDQGPALSLRYRTDVLDAEAAARIAGYYHAALEQLVSEPDAPVAVADCWERPNCATSSTDSPDPRSSCPTAGSTSCSRSRPGPAPPRPPRATPARTGRTANSTRTPTGSRTRCSPATSVMRRWWPWSPNAIWTGWPRSSPSSRRVRPTCRSNRTPPPTVWPGLSRAAAAVSCSPRTAARGTSRRPLRPSWNC